MARTAAGADSAAPAAAATRISAVAAIAPGYVRVRILESLQSVIG
ncbi:MAG TPA: hypothetical protein VMD06_05965 [Steroidobacteraceae bacterium]|nr:hypothetical protein [Steroidobacteraceae bacterium]